MKNLFFLLSSIMICACSQEPSCIDDRIITFEEEHNEGSFTFIYTFDQDGKTYHIFDNGIAFDAIAEVVDEDCNVVCVYGGNRPTPESPCDAFRDGLNNTKQIWP